MAGVPFPASASASAPSIPGTPGTKAPPDHTAPRVSVTFAVVALLPGGKGKTTVARALVGTVASSDSAAVRGGADCACGEYGWAWDGRGWWLRQGDSYLRGASLLT